MSALPDTVHVTHIDLRVSYSQAYLIDATDDAEGFEDIPDDHPAHRVGIIRADGGDAFLITGLHTGTVDFTVLVADHDPGAELDEYEDVVEITVESESGEYVLHEWGGEAHELPPLPAGPGWYRLRYHARGMDEAADEAASSGEVIDHYLLQIWPAEESLPRLVKQGSGCAAYWRRSA
ncbi:hypothetical protein [Nonomuraea candida]|uniref:hypothetical protein n=1 Tax=Nonomuraea candida TaxID=359159 RepID=UPI0012F8624E|nr:hypothetical protein [Nonomuraea candida]